MLKNMANVFGVVFILIGILGFIPVITTSDGLLLGIFHVDTIHNIVHLLSGAVALWAGMTSASASKTYFQVFGVVYALVTILGFIDYSSDKLIGLMAINPADTYLHLVIALVALYFGFASKDEAAVA
jgi:hypothetical protein